MRHRHKRSSLNLIFVLQSEVMSAGFAKFHPNLVVGGTYSGQIVLWDNRSNKRTPVQRTPLSAAAHTVIKLTLPFVRLKAAVLMDLKVDSCTFLSSVLSIQSTVSVWSEPKMPTT